LGKLSDPITYVIKLIFLSACIFKQLGSIRYVKAVILLLFDSLSGLGVFTNRAILSYNGPYNALGSNDRWSEERLDNFLEEGAIRGNKSLEILQKRLEERDWLALDRPTIADVSVFVYVALAPMGDISLQPYPAVLAWIERIKKLPGFISIPGLDDPLIRRK
jgi:glutathione S-transferase